MDIDGALGVTQIEKAAAIMASRREAADASAQVAAALRRLAAQG